MTCPLDPTTLGHYLAGRLTTQQTRHVHQHLDACADCWNTWNRFRWDTAASSPLYRDLQTFLGTDFIRHYDSSRALADDWNQAAPTTDDQIADFYRTSTAYLYNLTIWEASRHRPPYITTALPTLRALRVTHLIDYGCGIGSDTLHLRQHGLTVTPCDYTSPSTRFFQHRARALGQPDTLHEPHQLSTTASADTLWIIDTLDHLPNLDTALGHLLPDIRILICENLTTPRGHGNQRFHHRRTPAEIQHTLHHYGLHPHPQHNPHQHLTYWTRPHTDLRT